MMIKFLLMLEIQDFLQRRQGICHMVVGWGGGIEGTSEMPGMSCPVCDVRYRDSV